jgi:hypothetical protein
MTEWIKFVTVQPLPTQGQKMTEGRSSEELHPHNRCASNKRQGHRIITNGFD